MGYTDGRGLAVSTTSADALTAYEQGLTLALRWRSGAMDALHAAVTHDPHFALAHCARTYVGLRMGLVEAALAAHQQAMSLADHVQTEREHLHLQATDALARSQRSAAQTCLEQIAEQAPTDRLVLWLLSNMRIAQGDYLEGLALARRSVEACPDEPFFQTMTGFFLEQSGYNDEGLATSLRSLASDPANLYTYHAVGHAYQARGAYPQALATFERAASIERYAHILWHLAESQALLGNERLTWEYWASTAPSLPLFERIALLWRLEVIRHAPIDDLTWRDLAEQGERLLQQQADYLTVWMHHWIGLALARAGETAKAQQQIAWLRSLPEGKAGGYWASHGADLLEGEMAFMRGDLPTAVQLIAPAIEHLHALGGGSREQKDIFQDVFVELHRRLEHTDTVIELAQRRLLGNPNHLQSLAALAWAYQRTGQTMLQRHACRQLIARASELGLSLQTPELRDAQQALQVLT